MKSVVKRKITKTILVVMTILLIIGAGLGVFIYRYYGSILPRVMVLSTELSGMKREQAINTLKNKYSPSNEVKILYLNEAGEKQEFVILKDEIGLGYDYDETVRKAFYATRSGDPKNDIKAIFKSLNNPIRLTIEFNYNKTKLDELLSVFAGTATIEPVEPNVSVNYTTINIDPGKTGTRVNTSEITSAIENAWKQNVDPQINATIYEVDKTWSDEEVDLIYNRAKNLISKEIEIKADDIELTIEGSRIAEAIGGISSFNKEKVKKLVSEIAEQVERDPVNPVFVYVTANTDKNNRVEEFTAAKQGIKIDHDELEQKLLESFSELEKSEEVDSVLLTLDYFASEPEYDTADVNDLGIRELIGKGESYFRGSISSRIYNLNLAASRLNGYLIKPDEVFSFNASVGDISKLTGYKEAYVIQDGKTILGDGGGVCQVSTTVFRAAMDAGLPIVERRAHAYRVYYYEQGFGPGIDATIYQPTTDFKFMNDTGYHILIQSETDYANSKLTFYFYGTSDGRESTVGKPVITEQTAPPEDLYVDDPTLPAGEIKQIEHSAWGAKVYFDYKVVRDGKEVYAKRFYSNFRPWGNVFMRGTGPGV